MTATASAQNAGPTNPVDTGAAFRGQMQTGPVPTPVVPVVPMPTPTVPGPATGVPNTGRIAFPPPAPGTPGHAVVVDEATFDRPVPLPESLRAQPGGMTAASAAERAMSSGNAGVRLAQANLDAQVAARQEALRQLIPVLTTSARYTRLNEYTLPAITIPGAGTFALGVPIYNQFDVNVNLVIPLTDIPFRLYPLYDAANRAAESQQLNLDGSREQAGVDGRQAFYEYVRAFGQARVADDNVAGLERHLAEITQAAAAGTVARADLLQAHARLADARRLALVLHGGVELAEATLRQRLHMRADEVITIGENLDDAPVELQDDEALVRQAAHARAEVRAIDASMRSVDANISSIRSTQFPSVSVAGNFDIVNPNTRVFPQTDHFDTTWDVSLNVRWSPTQALISDATIDRLRANRAIAEAQQQQLREGIELQVRQSAINARNARAALSAARVALVASEEALRVQHERLSAGSVVASALQDAETDVVRQRFNYINTVLDYREALAQLDRAVGRTAVSGQARPH